MKTVKTNIWVYWVKYSLLQYTTWNTITYWIEDMWWVFVKWVKDKNIILSYIQYLLSWWKDSYSDWKVKNNKKESKWKKDLWDITKEINF